MSLNTHTLEYMLPYALGEKKADKVFKGGSVVNVFTGETINADVAVVGGTIVGVGSYSGEIEIDVSGCTIVPGFIDAHLHIESTLLSPAHFVAETVKHGTTTFIADPHEAANVAGRAGIDFVLKQTESIPANVFVMIPPCVPAVPFEENGYPITAEDIISYKSNPRVLGLGEVMDYPAVLASDKEMFAKLKAFSDMINDGHAPGLGGKELTAYILGGISTDHESTSFEEALEKVRSGLQVHIREGSAAHNLKSIVEGIVKSGVDTRHFSFCTDDKHMDDIKKTGHISYNVKCAIELGIKPETAIQMATINAARCYNLRTLGAVAPGYQADLLILNDLKSVNIKAVYHKGQIIPENINIPAITPDPLIYHTVNCLPVTEELIGLKVSDECDAIEVVDGQILTKHKKTTVPQVGGMFQPSSVFNKVVVVERHHAKGSNGVGVLLNYGISGGAIGSTVAHDSHNIIVVGDNDKDIVLAVRELEKMQGGYVVIKGGKVAYSFQLPLFGLMTDKPYLDVEEHLGTIIEVARNMCENKNIDPFITLSFLALPVIPELRITTKGLYDVLGARFINKCE